MQKKPRFSFVSIHKKIPIPYLEYLVLACLALLIGISFQLLLALGSAHLAHPSAEETTNLRGIPTDIQEIASSMAKACSAKGEVCYSDLFSKLAERQSISYTLQVLSTVEIIDPGARGCHLIAHSISSAETEKNPSDWENILTAMPVNACTGGFIHGVIEEKKLLDHSFVVNSETIPKICAIVEEKTQQPGSDQNCAHIMGHLALVDESNLMPNALQLCANTPDDMQYECLSGVFMENETRDNLIAHGLAKRIPWNATTTQDQQELCERATGEEAKACWRELAHMYVYISHDNPLSVYKLCAQAPDKQMVDACYQHAVGILTVDTQFSISNMKYLCQPYQADQDSYSTCSHTAVNSMMASSPAFTDRAIALCDAVPGNQKTSCYEILGDRLSHLVAPQQRAQYCALATGQYKKLCIGTTYP